MQIVVYNINHKEGNENCQVDVYKQIAILNKQRCHFLIAFPYIFLINFFLFFSATNSNAQTTVNYVMQDANFPTQLNDGGDFFNNGGAELGMWANTGNKNTAAWRTFKTAGDNTGSNRPLQVGDVFKITVAATRAFGQIGFSLNAGGTQGGSYANNISGSRLYCNTNNYAAWFVNRSGGTTNLTYVPIQNIYKDYIFTIKITSSTTADVFMTVDGTDYRAYNITMNGAGTIDAFSIYGSDMWDGDSNENAFWKPTCSVMNSTSVELGYFLASGTYIPGIISDGLVANSTSSVSVNNVNIGGDAGSNVILTSPNTYTGTTTINANAMLKLGVSSTLSASGPLGSNTGGTAISAGGVCDMNGYSLTASATEALTLNGAGISGGGALVNTSATQSEWAGNISLASASSVGGTGDLLLSGILSGTGALTKIGSGKLILSNPSNTCSGATSINAGELRFNPTSNATFASPIILNGGTLSTTSIASTRIFTSTSTIQLSASSTLALGNNSHTITFAASNAVPWTAGQTLTIIGWSAASGVSGKIFVGSTATSLTATQLSQIVFLGFGAATQLSTGEIVPAAYCWIGGTSSDWHNASNWFRGLIPTSATDVVIPSGTSNNPIISTNNALAKSITINSGATLAMSGSVAYSLTISSNGNFTNNGTFTAGIGTIIFSGTNILNGTTSTTFQHLTLNGVFTCNTIPLVNGTLTLNTGSYFATSNSCRYGASSLLVYNTGGIYGRGFEWNQSSGAVGTTIGYPNDVRISNNTVLNFPNTGTSAFSATIALARDLTIDAGAALYMDYGGGSNKSGAMLAGRNVGVNGILSLGSAFGGDLRIAGNYIVGSSGSVINNGRAVIFQGAAGDQIVTKVGGGIIYFDFIVVNKALGNVQFTTGTNATIISTVNNNTSIRVIQLLSGGIDMNDGVFTLQGDNQYSMNILVSGGVRRIFTSTGTGDFNIGGSTAVGIPKFSVISQSGGSLLFDNNVVVATTVGVDFGPSGITTVNAILRIDANGYVINNSPDYGSASTLIYNNGPGGYKRNLEWNTNTAGTTGAGYPNNVLVQNNTPLELNSIDFPANFPLGCSGNFTIQSGSSVSTTAMAYPITIGGDLTIGGTLTLSTHPAGLLEVGGSWNRTGTFVQNDRNVTFNGALNGNITATGGQTFSFMTMNKTSKFSTLSIDEHIAITDSIGLIQGTLVLNGRGISIVSNASKTARIGVSSKDNTSIIYAGGSLGSFFVQRYLPARRSWRLLAAPFVTAGSISEAWQEGNAFDYSTVASTTSSITSDTTTAAFATQITGGTIADGFDRGITNNPSIKYFDGTNWVAPLNTNGTGVKSKEGWMLFVRGDRKNFGQITNQFKSPTTTTLRPRGRINIGDKVINGVGLTVVGNPYASAIDFTTLTKSGTLTGVNSYTVWDPYLGGTFGVGAFVSFTWNGSSFVKSNVASTFDDRFIPSGAAIMVDFGAGGTLTFKESDKRSGNTTTAFRPVVNQLNALLYTVNSDNTQYVSDGTTILFGQNFSNSVDNGDVLKVSNFSENISITTQSKFLSIARTKIPRNKDTVYFAIRNMKLKNYRINLSLNDISAPGGLAAFFEDVFLNRKISLRMNDSLNYYFSVTNDSGSYASNRFRIVFRPYAQFLQVSARAENADIKINWQVGEELDIDRYDIERSNDAITFVGIGNQLPTNNNAIASYNFIDVQPAAGTYYYRIRSRSINGTIGYSNVIKIVKGRTPDQMYVFPNPVANYWMQIRMPNYANGIYSFKLLTQEGQLLMEQSFQLYLSKGMVQSVKLNEQIPAGVYNLVVTRPDKIKETLKVVIE